MEHFLCLVAGRPVGFFSWHALGEFLDEGFIFLLIAGQIGWYLIDRRSINLLKGVSAVMNCVRMFNQSALGASGIAAKGMETRSAPVTSSRAELKWLDPH